VTFVYTSLNILSLRFLRQGCLNDLLNARSDAGWVRMNPFDQESAVKYLLNDDILQI
jgi:hypothetical protein